MVATVLWQEITSESSTFSGEKSKLYPKPNADVKEISFNRVREFASFSPEPMTKLAHA
jgi:hypothetical protein